MMRAREGRRSEGVLSWLGVFIWLAVAGPAFAQAPAGFEGLIEEAKKSGSTVIVVTPPEPSASTSPSEAQPSAIDRFHDLVTTAVAEIRRLASGWGDLGNAAERPIALAGPDGTASWVLPAVLLGLVALAVGGVVALALWAWVRNRYAIVPEQRPTSRSEVIFRIFGLALTRLGLLALMLFIGLLLVATVDRDETGWRATITTLFLMAALLGGIWVIFSACLAPREPSLRIVSMTDGEARRLFLHLMLAAAIGMMLLGLHRWMVHLGVAADALKPLLIVGTLVMAAAFSAVVLLNRRSIERVIAGPHERTGPSVRRTIGRAWSALALAYFWLAAFVGIVRVLLDRPNAIGLVGVPIVVTAASVALYGMALAIIDLFAARREARTTAKRSGEVIAGPVMAEGVDGGSGVGDAEGGAQVLVIHQDNGEADQFPFLQKLLERAAAIVAIAFAFYLLAKLWGIDQALGTDVSSGVVEIVATLVLAYIAYHATRLWIDRRIASEALAAGSTSSRLATLMPVFRNFLLVTICVISGLVVLSRMGIDIGPLLAGAGVVGIAIGFGAQTLVKDIISGAFFLADDAFRVGEYIDIGDPVMGTVEKISIRSMQLRHHDGPIYTVPYGTIGHVNNYSRDWSVMKLPLRLAADTDVRRVKKLIRVLSEELAQDPEIGGMFLDKLKFQGIHHMDDTAMVVRVKFMARPDDKFTLRGVVYARVTELFLREGIHFAPKEVRVQIAESSGPTASSEKAMAAAAAAGFIAEESEQSPPVSQTA